MPAMVSHSQFALRVFSKLEKSGIPVVDKDMAMIGAQGPDIFFFHRTFPWQRGESYASVGGKLHRYSPARLFEGFRSVLITQDKAQYDAILGYIQGFFCHYALDRSTHPYILWAQQVLQKNQPQYGVRSNQYHYRIESALDSMVFRRDTGRPIGQLSLPSVLPPDRDEHYQAVGHLYADLLFQLFGTRLNADRLAQATGDMRHALYFMNDRHTVRQQMLHPIEKLWGRGAFATSLMRPAHTNDWDYANESHAVWENTFDRRYTSSQSFFELYDNAIHEAVDMIKEFMESLPLGKSMHDITQDRGFASDLPGVYGEKPLPLSSDYRSSKKELSGK